MAIAGAFVSAVHYASTHGADHNERVLNAAARPDPPSPLFDKQILIELALLFLCATQ